jgi:hypothetical protein
MIHFSTFLIAKRNSHIDNYINYMLIRLIIIMLISYKNYFVSFIKIERRQKKWNYFHKQFHQKEVLNVCLNILKNRTCIILLISNQSTFI